MTTEETTMGDATGDSGRVCCAKCGEPHQRGHLYAGPDDAARFTAAGVSCDWCGGPAAWVWKAEGEVAQSKCGPYREE